MRSSSSKPAFNRILGDLAKRQLQLDFQFGSAAEQYEAERNIGAGAFGIVCEAVETTSCEKVAIKKIGHASATPTLARRTLREIRVLRYIKHENIVSLRDIFRTPGPLGINVYLVMDLMEGSLHHVIHGGEQLDDDLVAHFTHQLLRGLRYLHKAGIAHRDLKPSNLLVNSDCTLRIADFGMAKLALRKEIEEAEEHCFYMTQHVATLPYRAPELLFVMPEHSTAVDMWAVGCILAEMLMRRELFPGRSVSGQIKIILANLGMPNDVIMAEIQCERTRRLIENYGEHNVRPWAEIVATRDRPEIGDDVLDLIGQLCALDVNERATVQDAISHPFMRHWFGEYEAETSCPFKVKMDMAAVESLSHAQLTEALVRDVRPADQGRYPDATGSRSGGSDGAKPSTDCSSEDGSASESSEKEAFVNTDAASDDVIGSDDVVTAL